MVCLYSACLRKHRLGDKVIFLINLCPETIKSQDQKNVSKTSMTSLDLMVTYTVHSSSGFLPKGHFQDGGCDVAFLRLGVQTICGNLWQFVNVSSFLETEPHHNHIK